MEINIGCLVAHCGSPFKGSLGAFVTNPLTNDVGLLSSYHVIAGKLSKPGDRILATPHKQANRRQIGQLGPGILNSETDAAVAWLTDGVRANTQIPGQNGPFCGVRDPIIGETLTKVGGRSGLTRAKVTAIDYFPTRYGKRVQSVFAMVLEPLYGTDEKKIVSQNGDCGSVWFDEVTKKAIGLHFAGESYAAYGAIHAKACFMSKALENLNVNLYAPNGTRASA